LLHVVCDSYATRKHADVCFFSVITRQAIRRGSFNLGQGPDVSDWSIRQPSAAPTP